ncbi:TetR/AcrR family transcriptional regulator [Streptomyces roseoverticillatus]|uniref:TetR/AcrR family transcriptional regulator n=1 Tax=Streptomyces roseoverticillatus TaxID=66429 RepID=UPI000693DB7D|nr:TetR family transcriptional regulator [Streptomyces roseoverticillatus]
MTPSPTAAPAAPPAAPASGMRGRKRERTRRAIADAAFRLFADEGFDAVTLTRIAAAADVAPATVFTHYASKEDIFFGRRLEFEPGIAEAVRGATTGTELVERLRRACTEAIGTILAADSLARTRTFSRILLDSPSLRRSYLPLARERRDQLLAVLLERAGERAADADVRADVQADVQADVRDELETFASLAGAVRELGFDALHAALAAGEPAGRVREAAVAALDRGYGRLARAYGDAPFLAAG